MRTTEGIRAYGLLEHIFDTDLCRFIVVSGPACLHSDRSPTQCIAAQMAFQTHAEFTEVAAAVHIDFSVAHLNTRFLGVMNPIGFDKAEAFIQVVRMKSCAQSDCDVVFSELLVLRRSTVRYVICLDAVPSQLSLRLQSPGDFVEIFCTGLSERNGVAAFDRPDPTERLIFEPFDTVTPDLIAVTAEEQPGNHIESVIRTAAYIQGSASAD